MPHLEQLARICFDLLVIEAEDDGLGRDPDYAAMSDAERSAYLEDQATRCAFTLMSVIREQLRPELESVADWRERTSSRT